MFSTKLMHYEEVAIIYRQHFVSSFYYLREIFTERRFQRYKLWTKKVSINVYFYKKLASFVIPEESQRTDASSVTNA